MENLSHRHIYPKAAKAYEDLRQAIRVFEAILHVEPGCDTPNFYQARNLLREGESRIKEVLGNAKKLLGPLPGYVTEEYRQWRDNFVESSRILTEGEDFDQLRRSLLADEFVSKWISEPDLDRLLERNFSTQRQGKRRLAHIKVRIILDDLFELLESAKDKRRRAFDKLQGGG